MLVERAVSCLVTGGVCAVIHSVNCVSVRLLVTAQPANITPILRIPPPAVQYFTTSFQPLTDACLYRQPSNKPHHHERLSTEKSKISSIEGSLAAY